MVDRGMLITILSLLHSPYIISLFYFKISKGHNLWRIYTKQKHTYKSLSSTSVRGGGGGGGLEPLLQWRRKLS